MSVRIVGLGGSLSPRSASLAAMRQALAAAAAVGAEVAAIDVGALRLPLYDPSVVPPEAARRFAAQAADADALIWSCPTYQGTVSGAFKNTVDWLQLLAEREDGFLTDRPVGLIATAAGDRAVQTVHTMGLVVQSLRGWPLPFSVPIGRAQRVVGGTGRIDDPGVVQRLDRLGELVVAAALRFRAAPLAGAPAPTAGDARLTAWPPSAPTA